MAESLLNNPLAFYVIIAGFIIFIIYHLKKRQPDHFKDIKPPKPEETLDDEFKKKFKSQGIKVGGLLSVGSLYVGYQKIARIDRQLSRKGYFETQEYNPKERTIKTKDKDKDYEKLFLRAKNPSIFWRLLGMKKQYYILDKNVVRYNHDNHSFHLPDKVDIFPYRGIWVMDDDGIEYCADVSIKKMSESAMTFLEFLPDRVSHLEIAQAKKERIERILSDIEKRKYEERKDAGDTTIT